MNKSSETSNMLLPTPDSLSLITTRIKFDHVNFQKHLHKSILQNVAYCFKKMQCNVKNEIANIPI